jgi:hypothetical protein
MARLFPLICLVCSAALGSQALATPAVRVEICEEGVPTDGSWPKQPQVTETYAEDVFGLFELPQKYVSTGVRADRAFPTLVRASATVNLRPGRHRLLLRSRGPARLRISGQQVLETAFVQPHIFSKLRAVGGELPFDHQDAYLNLGPGFRFAPPGNREAWCYFEFSGESIDVVLETLIGGLEPGRKVPFRPELGETVVAVSLEGTESWFLLGPGPRTVPYTDAGWVAFEAERRSRLDAMNADARAKRRHEHAEYWNRRRAAAAAWLHSTPEETVPPLPAGFPAHNAIDHFIGARIAEVKRDYDPVRRPPGTVDFHREIKPIFEAKCYQCHQGDKVKGGLRLDVREEAFLGGNSDGPAVVPHRPEASAMLRRIVSTDPDEVMPAKGDPLPPADIALLRRWIAEGASWPDFPEQNLSVTSLADDFAFLRRASLDTVGVVPSEAEIAAFLHDPPAQRRAIAIERLLGDSRWADGWMGYWLDVLAENPNLINPTLNNTGPFRWWIHESLLDNKPLDLFVTELVQMQGSERFGGPAGFGTASQNDVPAAAKGVILGSAFLGVEMKCARCHDSPTHSSKQRELFALAALLERKPVKVPVTSSVPMDHLKARGRKPLVEVTLPPGSEVVPQWPFSQYCDEQTAAAIIEHPEDSRDRLAALLTAPQNERFAQVMVNRIWERFMGRGIVEQAGDWEKYLPSHPQLLRWLARELVRSGYDAKAISRLILQSHAYQRAIDSTLVEPSPLFTAPAPRRLNAEQIVDSLFAATGKPFTLERMNIDLDSSRPMNVSIDLGVARRAWMLASTSNERDRPSLTLPRTQAVAEVMEVFGWRGERPDAIGGLRRVEGNVLQPALLANGTMMSWLVRLSDDHGLTRVVLEEDSVDRLVERLFLRVFTRQPRADERERIVEILRPGYESRVVTSAVIAPTQPVRVRPKYVAWSNHMRPEANLARVEQTTTARRGDPPTPRLDPEWRQKFEDVLWAMLNSPEATHIL